MNCQCYCHCTGRTHLWVSVGLQIIFYSFYERISGGLTQLNHQKNSGIVSACKSRIRNVHIIMYQMRWNFTFCINFAVKVWIGTKKHLVLARKRSCFSLEHTFSGTKAAGQAGMSRCEKNKARCHKCHLEMLQCVSKNHPGLVAQTRLGNAVICQWKTPQFSATDVTG